MSHVTHCNKAHLSNRNADVETPQRMLGGRGPNRGIHSVQITKLYHVLRLLAM